MNGEHVNTSNIPCCPELIKDDHCDVIKFSRVLSYPTAVIANRRRVIVEVILHFKFSRCTLGLTLGDPVHSTTLLPGEKVRLATTDRRSRFTFDSETKLSYRSEQISEEQYYMTAVQKYMADASAAQSGHASASSDSHWDFHGDASGSVNPFSLSASASTNAKGNHNSHSVADYLNQQRSHVQSSAAQAVSSTRKAHSLSIGEVNTRTHIEGESQDHFEASSREFSNPNRCHAVTFLFYQLNKKQKISFELEHIERRILDEVAPVGGILTPEPARLPVAVVPQDIPATVFIKRTVAANALAAPATAFDAGAVTGFANAGRIAVATEPVIGTPVDGATRARALKEVDDQLIEKKLIDRTGKITEETKKSIHYELEFSLPTPGVIVKGCLDECGICEPWVEERMKLENELLKRQIELLDKSQEYRCCPPAPVIAGD
jgi:hypothetical protein